MKVNRWRLALMAAALVVAVPFLASANIPVFTKTCVDVNGGELCEDDWVRCTLHVEVSGATETFTITQLIPGSFYKMWRSVQNPPIGINASTLENVPLTTSNLARYSWSGVVMNPGSQFDFIYEVQLRSHPVGATNCSMAIIRNSNLEGWNSNNECVTYNCVPPNTPVVQGTKVWNGPNPVVVGTPVTFEIEITNIGNAPDTNVRFVDILDSFRFAPPSNVTFNPQPDVGGVNGHTVDVTYASVDPGSVKRITIETQYANCQAGAQDGPCNQGTITSDSIVGSQPTDNPNSPGVYGDQTCRNATPGGNATITNPPLKEMVDVNGGMLQVGDVLHITVSFENTSICGGSTAFFRDAIPAEVSYVNNSVRVTPASGTSRYDAPTRTVHVDSFNIGPSGITTIEFDVRVDTVARICNTGGWSVGVSNPSPTTTACVGGAADQLAAVKSHSNPNGNGSVMPGQIFDYTIAITNSGAAAVPDASVSDLVPSCFDVLAVTQAGGGTPSINGNQVDVTQINVPPGASPTNIVIRVQENGSCPLNDTPCNNATVDSGGLPGPITTNDACIRIGSAQDQLTATKAHDDPNGNNTVSRGQTVLYTIAILNQGGQLVPDASVSDQIPSCFEVVQVVDAAGGVVTINGNQVDVSSIAVPTGANPTEVIIEVRENGSCAGGTQSCNSADVTSGNMPSPVTTNDACLVVNDCAQAPGAVEQLQGVKAAPGAEWSWMLEGGSVDGYNVYSVTVKSELDKTDPTKGARGSNPQATLQCSSAAQATTTCTDPDALDPTSPRLYYEAVGLCAGTEGAN